MSLPGRPMSERQQMKLLEKQRQEEEAAAAAASSRPDEEKPTTTIRRTRSSKQSASTKKNEQPRKLSLQERKEMARKEAKANRKGKDQSPTSTEETEEQITTSQVEDDFGDEESRSSSSSCNSSEAEFEEDLPRKKKKSVSKKRRRIVEDEESSCQNEEDVEKPVSKRLKRVVNRTRRNKQASDTMVDSDSEEKEESQEDTKDNASTRIPKKGSIPRKQAGADEQIPRKETSIPKKQGEIPRRKLGDGTNSKATSSIVQNMGMPGNPAFQTASMNPTSAALLSKSLMQPSAPINRGVRNNRGETSRMRNPEKRYTTPVDAAWSGGGITPPPQPVMDPMQKPAPLQVLQVPRPPAAAAESQKENDILQAISSMCDSLNKDNRFQIRTATAIDMSGSFLSDDRYDFFDVDSQGDIMLQAKIPIFPEDFPPGKTEWPLSWWGIVDPALAPAPDIVAAEVTDGTEERTVAVEAWPTHPNEQPRRAPSQQMSPTLGQTGPPPPAFPSHPPPPHFRPPQDIGGRGGRGRGGGGGPWRGGRGGQPPPLRNAPPPMMHNVPHANYPPRNGPPARGRGRRPGDRPHPSAPDNWRPPPGHRY